MPVKDQALTTPPRLDSGIVSQEECAPRERADENDHGEARVPLIFVRGCDGVPIDLYRGPRCARRCERSKLFVDGADKGSRFGVAETHENGACRRHASPETHSVTGYGWPSLFGPNEVG